MKPRIKSIRRGERIWALIDEVQSENQVVINFDGDLIRVQNETGRTFRTGQRVVLQVTNSYPLQFKLLTGSSLRERGERRPLDISI